MQDRLKDLLDSYEMLPSGCTVLCAVSGGADSVYLLHRLYQLRAPGGFRLVAAHYNHHLRGAESDRDEAFVRDFVDQYCGPEQVLTPEGGAQSLPPVELLVGGGDVASEARRRGAGLEETARAMRYAFLEAAARRAGADRIATAHTADDNAETVLLHLARGSGLRGLTGIPPRRGKLIRPMLTTTRQEVEAYLRLYGLPHVEDSSNADDTYRRNRVRHQVIPAMDAVNPRFAQRVADTAALLRVDEDYLTAQAAAACTSARRAGDCLTLPARQVADLPDALAPRAVRTLIGWLKGGDDGCAAAHLLAVVALCRGADPSGQVDLPGDLLAWREYELLCLGPAQPPPPLGEYPVVPPCLLPLGESGWTLECRDTPPPAGAGDGFFPLDRDKIEGAVRIRPRRTGDALALPGRGSRSLKRLLIDRKVPRRHRDGLPVLADEAGVLAVAGLGPDSRRLALPGQPALWARFIRTQTAGADAGAANTETERG